MKSKIGKLYNVLVIGGSLAASGCTKDEAKKVDSKEPPAQTTPAKSADPTPVPAKADDNTPTPTEKAPAATDPAAPVDDKTKKTVKKGDKAADGSGSGSGVKGWS